MILLHERLKLISPDDGNLGYGNLDVGELFFQPIGLDKRLSKSETSRFPSEGPPAEPNKIGAPVNTAATILNHPAVDPRLPCCPHSIDQILPQHLHVFEIREADFSHLGGDPELSSGGEPVGKMVAPGVVSDGLGRDLRKRLFQLLERGGAGNHLASG